MAKNKITKILGNDVSWHVDSKNVTELDECTIEHIQNLIADECFQGQVCMTLKNGKETTGWWHTINWEDIALELYNSLTNINDVVKKKYQQKAIKRFKKEWVY